MKMELNFVLKTFFHSVKECENNKMMYKEVIREEKFLNSLLAKRRERLQNKLEKKYLEDGLTDEVIQLSEKLDKVINKLQIQLNN